MTYPTLSQSPQVLDKAIKYLPSVFFSVVLTNIATLSAQAVSIPSVQSDTIVPDIAPQNSLSVKATPLSPMVSQPGSPSFTVAQAITAADDGTGTEVNQNGNIFEISGGTQAGNNLFHSFEQLGLDTGQIANILSNSDIDNVLGRVVGGEPSVLNGMLQVTGGEANLFLMNPSGVIFGNDFQLSVPGSFTATTADAIEIDDFWFNATGTNTYENLAGTPSGFAFINSDPGAVINGGDFTVYRGEQVTLLGGAVVNTGTINAPGGTINISSVPGKNMVEISQEGSLLSLGLPRAEQELNEPVGELTVSDIPALLAGADVTTELGIVVDNGVTKLASTDTAIPTTAGTTIISGEVNVADTSVEGSGGAIDVLGERVGLLDAVLDASGTSEGGDVRIGGDYQGGGTIANAERTYVDRNTTVVADAVTNGSGGRVIVWADNATDFYGNISAQGGELNGDGGFVEVSGRSLLNFDGEIDVSATAGNVGTLLLDPDSLTIVDAIRGTGSQDENLPTLSSDPNSPEASGTEANTISWGAINDLGSTANVVLEASGQIMIADITGVQSGQADLVNVDLDEGYSLNIRSTEGNIIFSDTDDTISTSGGAIIFSGNSLDLGNLDAGLLSTSGNVSFSFHLGGKIDLTSSSGNVTVGDMSANGVFIDSAGDINAGKILSVATEEGSVNLEALQGDITVRTIDSSAEDAIDQLPNEQPNNSIRVVASGLFQAIDTVPDSLEILGIADFDNIVVDIDDPKNSTVRKFLESQGILDPDDGSIIEEKNRIGSNNFELVFQNYFERQGRFVYVIPAQDIGMSIIARLNAFTSNSISIQHGGVTVPISSSFPLQISGEGDGQFIVGPPSSGFEVPEEGRNDTADVLNIISKLEQYVLVETFSPPLVFSSEDFPDNVSGSVGAIMIGNENGDLGTSVYDRPFIPPPPTSTPSKPQITQEQTLATEKVSEILPDTPSTNPLFITDDIFDDPECNEMKVISHEDGTATLLNICPNSEGNETLPLPETP